MALLLFGLILQAALANSSEEIGNLTKNQVNNLNSSTVCKVPSHKDSILLWNYRLFECLKEDKYDFLFNNWINSLQSNQKEITAETRQIWTQYKQKAWGKDLIRTDNGEGLDDIGLSLMIVDNIDTLFFIGTADMYNEAINYLVNQFQLPDQDVPTLQLIKLLGTYLTAYDLSRWPGTLEKAMELGEILIPVFSYKGEKLMNKYVNPVTKKTKTVGQLSVGDITQITEFLKLWRVTSDERYYQLAQDVTDWLYINSKNLKSIPTHISLTGVRRNQLNLTGRIALDEHGLATSRNLFNAYLASNKTLPHLKELYDKQKRFFIRFLNLNTSNDFLFIAEQTSEKEIDYRMHEAACGWSGQLAIDSLIFGYNATEMILASRLLNTCLEMHSSTASSLPPEYALFKRSGMYLDTKSKSPYHLTSYLIESVLHMWRLTHDINLKKLGYTIYKSLKQRCADYYGYSGVKNVHEKVIEQDKRMPSYFLTRVMKPLYLLFSPVRCI